MEFQILGSVRAVHAGSALPLGGPRHRRLLAVLLVHAGQAVPTDRLTEALWGDDPPRSAAEMVHVRVSELRAALRPARSERHAGLVAGEGGYHLEVGPDELDAGVFARRAAAGSRALAAGDAAAARDHLTAALAAWRGPALGEFADEPFARTEAARLEALRLQAFEDRIAAELALGRHAAVVAELEALVAGHPLREPFREQLMLALYRAGRQGDALQAYAEARDALADQLGVDPGPGLARLHAAILRQDPALDAPPPRAEAAAPARVEAVALTSFVGRARDLAETRERLRAGRLVTLTGVGGAGKSRLALEVAAACGAEFPDGTWVVELAPLAQPGLVAPAVAAALRVRERPQRTLLDLVAERLRDAAALLVLDNCEHLLDETAGLADHLLRACPRLRVLATSRERLGITGEHLWPVGGLGLPAPGDTSLAAAAASDAVRLLVERAAAVWPGFALTGATAATLTQICQRLDGLPLAIELAAAAVPALGVDQIASRLDDRFRLLTRGSRTASPRHQTLRAVVDWSYDLLDPPARRLFDRLGVFVGGFTLEAAEAVCAAEGEPPVAQSLPALVDKSLVTVDSAGTTPRYRLLETLRAYALARQAEQGPVAPLRDRHAAYTLAVVTRARRALRGAQQPVWLRRLEAEHGNIRAALEWSIERGDAGTAVRLAGSLYPLWDRHGHYREGRAWLARALELPAEVPALVRARALDSAAGLAAIQGDLPAAAAEAEESARLSREAGDGAGAARALTTSGLAAFYAGDNPRAVRVLEESVRRARAAGDRGQAGFALMYLSATALARGDWAEAVRRCDEGEPELRAVGDPEGLAWIDICRSGAAWRTGDRPAAADALREAIRGFQSLDHRWGLSICLQLAAAMAADRADHRRAVWLAATSEAQRHEVAAAQMPFLKQWLDSTIAACRQALDGAAFTDSWQSGQATPPARRSPRPCPNSTPTDRLAEPPISAARSAGRARPREG
ncbi:BTAD domain-containing putative transcriptional regulator [Phytohabitans houttuyneae]|uniref:BTAD domain-containing putative transcriptional regulator n=1 Tax=Phytohabitans houttuyneae TaxID=1076126 RepID=UPI001567686A|nr:BTAD domain-containing putative transcriptional regulator [Phytohabitans houttuyneae]